MKVAIIIVNFNGKNDTLECLESLRSLKTKSLKLVTVVVDNASIDGSIELIKKKYPQVKLILNKENLGFAEGNNAGINYALGLRVDYLLVLNNDTLVDKMLLINLIKKFEVDKDIGIASPKIYFAPGFEFHKEKYSRNERGKVIWYAGGIIDWQNIFSSHHGVDQVDKGQYDKEGETDFSTGCCMLVKKEVFNKIGNFNKKYFLYWEDIDLCLRAKKAGFKVYYIPQAFLWHKNASASGGAGGKTPVYYQTRNRLLFALKYASLKTKLLVLKQGVSYLFSKNQWQKKAAKDFFMLRFGKLKE